MKKELLKLNKWWNNHTGNVIMVFLFSSIMLVPDAYIGGIIISAIISLIFSIIVTRKNEEYINEKFGQNEK